MNVKLWQLRTASHKPLMVLCAGVRCWKRMQFSSWRYSIMYWLHYARPSVRVSYNYVCVLCIQRVCECESSKCGLTSIEYLTSTWASQKPKTPTHPHRFTIIYKQPSFRRRHHPSTHFITRINENVNSWPPSVSLFLLFFCNTLKYTYMHTLFSVCVCVTHLAPQPIPPPPVCISDRRGGRLRSVARVVRCVFVALTNKRSQKSVRRPPGK